MSYCCCKRSSLKEGIGIECLGKFDQTKIRTNLEKTLITWDGKNSTMFEHRQSSFLKLLKLKQIIHFQKI